jgi:hypothetical protein
VALALWPLHVLAGLDVGSAPADGGVCGVVAGRLCRSAGTHCRRATCRAACRAACRANCLAAWLPQSVAHDKVSGTSTVEWLEDGGTGED